MMHCRGCAVYPIGGMLRAQAMESSINRHYLLPHPVSGAGMAQDLVEELSVKVARRGTLLNLAYRLVGDLGALRLPEPRSPVRTDGLWRHCCFEAFIGHGGADDYWEYNFSPSGAWAAYHFAGYREGMEPLLRGAPPDISQCIGAGSVELSVVLDLSWLQKSPAGVALRLGLAAVIEDKAQVLSYWALKHPADKPDFHHAAGFVVDLD